MSNIDAINAASVAGYAGGAATVAPAANAAPAPGAGFSAVIAEKIRDGAMQAAASAGGGLSGLPAGYIPPQSQGVEEAILAAASSGQIDDAQIALFMLMQMMQSSQDGEFPMLMQMMASMIMQAQGDKEALRDSAMSSDFHPFILDSIDRHIFNWNLPQGQGRGQVVLPVEHWRPTAPAITSSEGNRSPELYRAVIDQFRVETAERYRPYRNGNTYCNIYVWDVTRAMGAELPHYTDPATGEPRYYPDISGASPMGAIATAEWLKTYGERYGWREADAVTAQMHANEGKPAVTSAGNLGHVQVVSPSRDGGFDAARGVAIAQAGSIVSNYTHISSIYGGNTLKNSIRYWVHD